MLNVITHASRLYTGTGILAKEGRRLMPEDMGMIEDGAVIYDAKKIIWVGHTKDLPKKYKKIRAKNLRNSRAVMPGLIDSHTHLVFAGSRAQEFARRCAGATYQEIANEGGGILTTVHATRNASEQSLLNLALARAKVAYGFGVRTMECKSGYGLDHETEIKCLRVVKKLQKVFPQMTFISTYLGAHAIPADQIKEEYAKEEYVREITQKTLPLIAQQKLARFCDVFVDEGYFSLQDAKIILKAAQALGLETKIHADELTNTESASLAAQLGAHSADHLLKISDAGILNLAKSKTTIATLLPGTAFYLKADHAPARKLLDAGARVAIATDFNPGSCNSLNLPFMLNLAALYLKMNSAEIFSSVTFSAAQSLGLDRKGVLAPGYDSDLIVLPYSDFEEMYYRMGW